MRSAIHTSILRTIFLIALVAAASVCASAQHGYRVTKRVTFKKGQVSTTVSGAIPNTLESHEYIVRVRKGQTIKLKLHATRLSIGFYTMSPSNAMVEEETFLKDYTGTLEENGDYHIFVYTTKGAGKYSLDIQIATDI
jgi:hypothetical protein